MADRYDVTVIGGGPGGYVAAIRAAQLGMRVALVEKRSSLGGTCLNVGCIPSKALLHSSHLYYQACHSFADHGITATDMQLDLKAMMAHKDKVVDETIKGVDFLIKKNNIRKLLGAGNIIATGTVEVTPDEGEKETVNTNNIIIATGSGVTPLPGVDIDEKKILSSTGALSLPKVPKSLVVIGAGIIGLEMGSIWSRLGAEVTVVEYLDDILFGMDKEISKSMARILKRQGLNFKLKCKVTSAKKSASGVTISIEPRDGGDVEELKANVALVAVGRSPFTNGLGLENLGVKIDEHGFIQTNERFQTNVGGVYAIGDVIGGAMLAHKAEDEAVILAEILAGQSGHIDYNAIPGIVYTWPEVAGLGKTEEQLSDAGVAYKVGKFPFAANARARVMGDTDGMVKVLADAETDMLLGVHIIGPSAGELIQECVVAMEFGGAAEDIARICHGHPGLSEIVKEAALAADDRAIHI